jgi:hypothetical protein
MKTTWNIVKSVTVKRSWNKSVQLVYINGALSENQQLTADFFQNYFLSIAEKTVSNNNEKLKDNNCIDYLHRVFNKPLPNIIFDNTTSEIKKKSLSLSNLKIHMDMIKFR